MGIKVYDDDMRQWGTSVAERHEVDQKEMTRQMRQMVDNLYVHDIPFSQQTLDAMAAPDKMKPARISICAIKWKGKPQWLDVVHGFGGSRHMLLVTENGKREYAWYAPSVLKDHWWIRAYSVPSAHRGEP